MHAQESEIKSHILNKRVTNIEFYNINDTYLVVDENSSWVIDGGIQIEFGDEVFCFGWNYEQEGFDYLLGKPIDQLFGDAPFYSLGATECSGIAALMGSEIKEIDIIWDYYQEFDENAQLKEEKIYVPVQLLLTFNFNETLQLALINFEIKDEPFGLINTEYSLNGELFISLNKEMKIPTPRFDAT